MKIDLKIPNLGEAEDTEIIEVSVKKGEKIKKNDPLIVLESEKAAMEVPADHDGVIINVLVKEGESVSEGKVFATLEVKDGLHINNENCNLCQSEICPVCRNSDERTPYVLLNAKMSNSHDEHCPKGTNQVYLDHWF